MSDQNNSDSKTHELNQVFTEELVQKLAKLSYLNLTGEQAVRYAGELTAVFGYVKKLESYNITGVEPTYNVNSSDKGEVLREDQVLPSLSTKEGLSNAPDRSGNFFRVPIIIDQSGEH